ncbi:hypothetical protein A3Q56_02440 [Intoshia linei]|uniref:Uncharacterized protein n=1 Tax=Intoshia linei TaxID=1819745 RepID=A0A177B8R5_9BILA|nr:hypothetical protein A3Q56_02440 [Intoshia linei]
MGIFKRMFKRKDSAITVKPGVAINSKELTKPDILNSSKDDKFLDEKFFESTVKQEKNEFKYRTIKLNTPIAKDLLDNEPAKTKIDIIQAKKKKRKNMNFLYEDRKNDVKSSIYKEDPVLKLSIKISKEINELSEQSTETPKIPEKAKKSNYDYVKRIDKEKYFSKTSISSHITEHDKSDNKSNNNTIDSSLSVESVSNEKKSPSSIKKSVQPHILKSKLNDDDASLYSTISQDSNVKYLNKSKIERKTSESSDSEDLNYDLCSTISRSLTKPARGIVEVVSDSSNEIPENDIKKKIVNKKINMVQRYSESSQDNSDYDIVSTSNKSVLSFHSRYSLIGNVSSNDMASINSNIRTTKLLPAIPDDIFSTEISHKPKLPKKPEKNVPREMELPKKPEKFIYVDSEKLKNKMVETTHEKIRVKPELSAKSSDQSIHLFIDKNKTQSIYDCKKIENASTASPHVSLKRQTMPELPSKPRNNRLDTKLNRFRPLQTLKSEEEPEVSELHSKLNKTKKLGNEDLKEVVEKSDSEQRREVETFKYKIDPTISDKNTKEMDKKYIPPLPSKNRVSELDEKLNRMKQWEDKTDKTLTDTESKILSSKNRDSFIINENPKVSELNAKLNRARNWESKIESKKEFPKKEIPKKRDILIKEAQPRISELDSKLNRARKWEVSTDSSIFEVNKEESPKCNVYSVEKPEFNKKYNSSIQEKDKFDFTETSNMSELDKKLFKVRQSQFTKPDNEKSSTDQDSETKKIPPSIKNTFKFNNLMKKDERKVSELNKKLEKIRSGIEKIPESNIQNSEKTKLKQTVQIDKSSNNSSINKNNFTKDEHNSVSSVKSIFETQNSNNTNKPFPKPVKINKFLESNEKTDTFRNNKFNKKNIFEFGSDSSN